jgi:deoxyribodipyrimidine photolyase
VGRRGGRFYRQRRTAGRFCQQHQVSHLFYNYQYEFNERQRDAAVENTLRDVICQGFDDSVLLPPGSVLTGGGEMYKVFTPFKNAFIRRLRDGAAGVRGAPKPRQAPARQRRRCLSLTIRKRRSMGCCLPRMKNGAGAAARVLSASGGGL